MLTRWNNPSGARTVVGKLIQHFTHLIDRTNRDDHNGAVCYTLGCPSKLVVSRTYLPKNGSGNLDEEDEPPEGEYDRQTHPALAPKC